MARPSRPVRGMNAALAGGEAGVGEIRPARPPIGPWRLALALLLAVAATFAGIRTYHAVASRPVTFNGQVTPAHAYYLNFPNTGTVETLTVKPGDHVTAGQVLATQVSSVAAANLAAAQAAVDADTALLAEDGNPTTAAGRQAQSELNLAKAQAAADSTQNALTLAQAGTQSAITAQNTVISADQATLDEETARFTRACQASPATATTAAGSPATAGTTAASPASTTPTAESPMAASPEPSVTASAPSTTTATPPARQESCQSLRAQIDRDTAQLARARARLGTLQSAGQAHAQQLQTRLTQSQSVLEAARTTVASQGAPLTPAAIARARSQLASAQAQLAADQLALQQITITAPADGTVVGTAGATGDIVGPQGVRTYAGPAAQAGTLADQQPGIQLFVPTAAPGANQVGGATYSALVTLHSGPLGVTAQLPESRIADVREGRPATISVPATGHTVTGRVDHILLQPARVPGATYYNVTISLDDQREDLMPGMSAEVTLS
ncbi:hypothetical protein [Kitasatospora sp. NPDC088346]|uniref:hypothetical protein n=1 Tax=Kitasatospora sp. NPDC088346 TaxID=3364073 RepID=UPI003801F8B9